MTESLSRKRPLRELPSLGQVSDRTQGTSELFGARPIRLPDPSLPSLMELWVMRGAERGIEIFRYVKSRCDSSHPVFLLLCLVEKVTY